MYRFEKACWNQGFELVAGMDEAGRGPLAGPVVAACVILPSEKLLRIKGIKDSKVLSEKKREELYEIITQNSQVGIGVISEKIVDQINIYQATCLAMKTAYEDLEIKPNILLVDGTLRLDIPCEYRNIIKGDSKSASVAAGSIIAKVTRDRLMRSYHEKYPQYEFSRHKGYGTKRHKELLEGYGPCPIHRKTFSPVSQLEECYIS
jgi:ribonuclease HII